MRLAVVKTAGSTSRTVQPRPGFRSTSVSIRPAIRRILDLTLRAMQLSESL
jgi:hypothetical protein